MIDKRVEIDLRKKEGLFKLTKLFSEESAPLYNLEATIRDRLENEGVPLSFDDAIEYNNLLKAMNKNSGILSRLIEQAIKLQSTK